MNPAIADPGSRLITQRVSDPRTDDALAVTITVIKQTQVAIKPPLVCVRETVMADVAAVKNRESQANVIGRVVLCLHGRDVQALEHENQGERDN